VWRDPTSAIGIRKAGQDSLWFELGKEEWLFAPFGLEFVCSLSLYPMGEPLRRLCVLVKSMTLECNTQRAFDASFSKERLVDKVQFDSDHSGKDGASPFALQVRPHI